MSNLVLVSRAYARAALWHSDQRRKGIAAEPYMNHLVEVADLVSRATRGRDPSLVAAAVLHDAIEDQLISHFQIATEFNEDIADLVDEVTDNKLLPWKERKRLQVQTAAGKSPRARMIKIADKISNLRSILQSPPADWSGERKVEYLHWTRKVVARASGCSPFLESEFRKIAGHLENELLNSGLWIVYVDDNFYFMDESERYMLKAFNDYGDAKAACKRIVDDFLEESSARTAEELRQSWSAFGEDPWIKGPKPAGGYFAASEYVRRRCKELRPDSNSA